MEKFKKRYGIRLKSCRGERHNTDNIAFDYDDNDEANESKTEVELKAEDGGHLYEPAFITVNNLEDEPLTLDKTETNNKEKNYEKVMNCVDEVIQWSVANEIEPLYLTMLKSLRERIRYQAMT